MIHGSTEQKLNCQQFVLLKKLMQRIEDWSFKYFPHLGNNGTYLLLFICLSPFLWMGQIFDFFILSGNMAQLIQFLNRTASGFKIAESNFFQYPFRYSIISTCLTNLIKEILAFVIQPWKSGLLLSPFNGTHCDAKHLLKIFDSSLKSETVLFLIWSEK